jgi:hypothetical protein
MKTQCAISQQRLKGEHSFEVHPCGSPKNFDGKIRKNEMKKGGDKLVFLERDYGFF